MIKLFLIKPILPAGFLVIILVFTLFLGSQNLQNKIRMTSTVNAASLQIQPNTSNVYDKMKTGSFINYLVVGDAIGQSDGAGRKRDKWFYQFEDQMKTTRQVTALRTLVTNPTGTVFGGWSDYWKLLNVNARYDLAIISFGQNDQAALDPQTYGAICESLIRNIKNRNPKTEILLLIENTVKKNAYPDILKKLSAYYGLTAIDIRNEFLSNQKEKLTDDGTLPNSRGYELYTGQIMQALEADLNAGKTITAIPETPLFPDSELFHTGKETMISPTDMSSQGFVENNNGYTGSRPGDYISSSFEGNVLGLNVETSSSGGIGKIYIDGKFAGMVDAYSKVSTTKKMFITSGLTSGAHSFKLVVTENKKKESSGTTIRLLNLITSDDKS
ncbi:SGNH/GDSL hydrolase family protein [Paenibacillus sepulcri]